jgi:putative ABC transport system ATP-binding protein
MVTSLRSHADAQRLSPVDVSTPIIELRRVSKSYLSAAGDLPALKAIDLHIDSGDFVSIIGKSGSGKSTLLNMITGIDRPTSGEVLVNGTAVHTMSENQLAGWRGANLGIIFQFFQLLPALSLKQNVILPMDLAGRLSPRERRERAEGLLELVSLEDQMGKLPSMVSGGQQQRAAMARALANDPPIVIADEPTGNLDSKTADTVFGLFESLVSQGKILIIVTHDSSLTKRAHRTALITDGEIERTKEIGVLRAIGARSPSILGMFVMEEAFQGMMSWLIAIPISLLASPTVASLLGDAVFGATLDYQYNWPAVGLWFGIILIISALASLLLARGAIRISVRDSLAYA